MSVHSQEQEPPGRKGDEGTVEEQLRQGALIQETPAGLNLSGESRGRSCGRGTSGEQSDDWHCLQAPSAHSSLICQCFPRP